MIKKLKIRMMLLVMSILILVTAGIVFSINMMNWHNIRVQAKEALKTLAQNSGSRPSLRYDLTPPAKPAGEENAAPPEKPAGEEDLTPPEKPEGEGLVSTTKPEFEEDSSEMNGPSPEEGAGPGSSGKMGPAGQPPEAENALASLSNYYVAEITSDGGLSEWTSDRKDLYTDRQVEEMAALALASGKEFGRIGTQFFFLTKASGGKQQVIVLDERLEISSARKVLLFTEIIAGAACLLLCIAAYFLVSAMIRPVQEAFDRQRQFVWDASHELKTPLAVIGSNAQVLTGEIGENEYLGYILSEVKRSDELLKNLLTLARMDKGTVKAQLRDMDLSQAVLSVALPFESTAFEAGKRFEIDVPDGIRCQGDEQMLQQLTVILLSNALKYSEEHGRIALSLEQKGRSCELRVCNDGAGISPEDQKRIFDRFYRADTSHNRETEGFGLGLSIAKTIVDAHHGTIRVSSEPDAETIFTVII